MSLENSIISEDEAIRLIEDKFESRLDEMKKNPGFYALVESGLRKLRKNREASNERLKYSLRMNPDLNPAKITVPYEIQVAVHVASKTNLQFSIAGSLFGYGIVALSAVGVDHLLKSNASLNNHTLSLWLAGVGVVALYQGLKSTFNYFRESKDFKQDERFSELMSPQEIRASYYIFGKPEEEIRGEQNAK